MQCPISKKIHDQTDTLHICRCSKLLSNLLFTTDSIA
uniref:Uncharacterized protein n=1 Tax=Rhizophora mucronata TaxID=61149 RepID=A0A2P2QKJ2_RHIMU